MWEGVRGVNESWDHMWWLLQALCLRVLPSSVGERACNAGNQIQVSCVLNMCSIYLNISLILKINFGQFLT